MVSKGILRYFVMQYIESGATLDDLLTGQPLEPIAALQLVLPLLSALEYAHTRGVVHRDIKPANIMLPSPDWPMLADFGIAKLIDESDQLTPPGQSVGTAIYMAPERAGLTTVDARTDLYSVGVVLYEMLVGQVPYNGVIPVEVLHKHVQELLPPPRDLNPQLPAAAEPVLRRALAKKPDDRYQSASAMAKDLRRLIAQIERLVAQQQLNEMLQQPVRPALARHYPYKTREFPNDLAPTVQTAIPRYRAPLPRNPNDQTPVYIAPPVARQHPKWLRGAIAGAVLLAALGGVLLGRGAYGRSGAAEPTARPPSATAAAAEIDPAATAGLIIAAPTRPAEIPSTLPQPTAPLEPAASALSPTAELPVAAVVPTEPPTPPASPIPLQTTPQVSQIGNTITILLEDTDWQGGYRRPAGLTYGGRTATWIYGSNTEYASMRARFALASLPAGPVMMTIEGMDSEDRTKTPIQVLVNGTEIFNGPEPAAGRRPAA